MVAMEKREFIPIGNGNFIPVRSWLPSNPRTVIVALHGQITHSGWFSQLGKQLADANIGLLAPDRRGSGEAKNLPIPEGAQTLISDVGLAIDFARSKCSDVSLLCWCFGAKIGLPAATKYSINRLILPSPSLIAAPEMSIRIKNLVANGDFYPIHFDAVTEFSDVISVQKFIAEDPLLLKKIPITQRKISNDLSSIAIEAVNKIKVPVLSILADQDKIIDIDKTAELLKGTTLKWFKGGHGFVIEPGGAEMIAHEIEKFIT